MTRNTEQERDMNKANLNKKMAASRAQAQKVHKSHTDDIQVLLEALAVGMDRQSGNPSASWGHVGDMADVREKLALALRVVAGSDFDHENTDVVVAQMVTDAKRSRKNRKSRR